MPLTRRPVTNTALLAACAVLVACSPLGSTGASPAVVSDAAQRLTSLTDMDNRVARVAQTLSEANAVLCPVVRQSAGWALHAEAQYSRELQPHARARFGLEGDLPGVLAAPPTSAAALAGARTGDLVLAVNGRSLDRGPERRQPVFEGLAANIAVLDRAFAAGATRVTVRRDGAELTITVQPHRTCGYEVQLNPSDELNARADGRRLFISTALASFTRSDDELALILGHELAHHVLRHRDWSDVGGAGREANDATAVTGVGDKEMQADRVGLYLAARAGYETRIAQAFWRRFGAYNWRVRYPQLRHASAEARARALEQVQVEIDAKRAGGGPLLP